GAGMHLQLGLDAVGRVDQQRPLLEKAVHLTDQAVDQLRSVIYALRTIDDGDGRLSRLIEDLCRLHVPSSMTTEVRVLGDEVPTTPGIEHELLRIAGEALANSARHSRGHGVVVTLDFG